MGDLRKNFMGRVGEIALLVPSLAFPPLALANSHEGRVLSKGVTEGAIDVVSSLVGFVPDACDFVSRGSTEMRTSSKIAEQLTAGHEWLQKHDPRGPIQVQGEGDEALYAAGKIGTIVGSFFIPGAGWAGAASRLGMTGRAVSTAGTLGNVYNKTAAGVAVTMGGVAEAREMGLLSSPPSHERRMRTDQAKESLRKEL